MKQYLILGLFALAAALGIGCVVRPTPTSPQPAAAPTAVPTPEAALREGLLSQVPVGYTEVVRWDVAGLQTGQQAQELREDFGHQWQWVEQYGISIADTSELVHASDAEGNTLTLLAGTFDWDLIHNYLYQAGFVDSSYRNVEIWRHPQQDLVVGFLMDRDQIVLSTSGSVGVRDAIRALDTGTGFLFENTSDETMKNLARLQQGVHLIWEGQCPDLDLQGCETVAYGARWGADNFTMELSWVFVFQQGPAARSAVSKVEKYFQERIPREVILGEVKPEGEYLLVNATIDRDRFAFPISPTQVQVKPEPQVMPRPTPTPPPPPVSLPPDLMNISFNNPRMEPPDGLVSWWPGDGNANDIVARNHGTLRGGVAYAPGLVGQGFLLDGEQAVVEVADSAELNLTGDLTVDLWARRGAFGGRSQMIAKGSAEENVPSVFSMGFNGDRPMWKFERADASNVLLLGSAIMDSDFHHYAYVRSGNTHKMFVDGELIKSGEFTGIVGDSTGLPLTIGAIRDPSNPSGFSQYFTGMIDEVSVYHRALSDEEVKSIYEMAAAGKLKPITDYCRQWNLSQEFRVSPYQENPNRDGCGNLDVWHLL